MSEGRLIKVYCGGCHDVFHVVMPPQAGQEHHQHHIKYRYDTRAFFGQEPCWHPPSHARLFSRAGDCQPPAPACLPPPSPGRQGRPHKVCRWDGHSVSTSWGTQSPRVGRSNEERRMYCFPG